MTRNINSIQVIFIVLLASLLTLVTPASTSLNQLKIADEPRPVDSTPRDGVQDHANIFGNYFYCIYPNGRYPDLKDCSRYYECRYWRPSHKKCPRNQHFDSKSEKCASKVLAVCGKGGGGNDKEKSTTETSVKITIEQVTTIEPVRMCPSLFGRFPHPHDCSKYVVCVLGKALGEKCGFLELYDDKQQKCRLRILVNCGSRIDPEGTKTTTTLKPSTGTVPIAGKSTPDAKSRLTKSTTVESEEETGSTYQDREFSSTQRPEGIVTGSTSEDEEFGSTSRHEDIVTESITENEEFVSTSRPEDIVTKSTTENEEFVSTSRPEDIVTESTTEDREFGSTSRPEDIVTESTTEDGEFGSTSRPEDIVTGTKSEDEEFGSTSRPEDIVTESTTEDREFGSTSRPEDIVTESTTEDGEFGSTSRPEDIVTGTRTGNEEFGSTSKPEDIATDSTPEDKEFGSTSVPQDIITGSTSEDEVFGSTSRPEDIRTGSLSTKDNIGISGKDRGTETTSISEQTETGEISSSESITASDSLTASTGDSSSLKPTDCKEDDLDCIIKETRFVCPKQYGYFAHPSSKSLFVHCDNFTPHVMKCGQGLVFSLEYLVCVRPT